MDLRQFFRGFTSKEAKLLVCALTVLIAAVDFWLPSNINIASFYFVCIVLLIWARSIEWLWICTAVFIFLTFGGISFGRPSVVHALEWVDWLNRSMTALALLAAAIPVHLRLRAMEALESTRMERDRVQEALQESHGKLEARVQERTRELKKEIANRERTEQDLRRSEQSLRQLSVRLMRSQDAERRKIARELHDSLGQYLSHSKMILEGWLQKRVASEQEVEGLSQIADSLDQCLTETRTISHLLHPPLLDELGFASAARLYVDGFSRRSGIRVNLSIHDMKRLAPAIELVLFRILQESLTNVLRHAQSPSVDIQVQSGDNQIALMVRDYGKGIPPEFVERFNTLGEGGGVGLSGMRERVVELHGNLQIECCAQGSLIRATLPLLTGSDTKDSIAESFGGPVPPAPCAPEVLANTEEKAS